MPDFVHLHTHSHYSILEAIGSIEEIISSVSSHGMKALTITDTSNMYATIEFYEAATKANIKPILGIEAWLDPKGMADRSTGADKVLYPVVLLARDFTGYLNLIQIASKSHIEGYLPTPKIDFDTLTQHSDGLIALIGEYRSELGAKILNKDAAGSREIITRYQHIFGDRLYLEVLSLANTPRQLTVNQALISYGQEFNIPLVLTANSYYTDNTKAHAHDIMLAIKNKTTLTNSERYTLIHEDHSLKSPQEMWDLCQKLEIPEQAFHNTVQIAEQCQVEIPLFQIQLPSFDVPKSPEDTQRTDQEYLRDLCEQGISKRYPSEQPTGLRERLDYELDVINNSGYASYFLIVGDFINWAKDQGVLVGPGRGSAAGSLVAYLVGITDLDPIKFELLFERFLNPARVSMPDIDVDFQDNKRDLVLQYVAQKYGRDHVAQICTFGTMAAKASIRDTGRALGYSYTLCDSVSKLIEEKTIAKSLANSPELKAKYEQDDTIRTLIDTAQILEGSVRHTSTHACAVVISKHELTAYTPLQISESGGKTAITTQYEMHGIEDLGLLKMDFLGLANLSIIRSTLSLIQHNHGQEIDMDQLPLDDIKAYRLFQKGQTTGVFQFESQGMKKALIGLRPSEFDDLIAMVSLYRPGPMELIPTYIARKHGEEEVKYLHPNLEKILKPTYGIMIYQEQLMQASQALAGFSLPEADILRKAVGKKIVELMEEQKVKIIDGVVNQGIDRAIGEQLWELIEPFGNYGFNKSHAACYALVAYQTAYLKAHYPLEFMISLMNSDSSDLTRIAIEIEEAKQLGLTIQSPNINTSQAIFSGSDTTIYYGLGSIRNFSEKLGHIIVQERINHGEFQSLQDFLDRIPPKELNKKNLEALVKSGSLDLFESRQQLIQNLDTMIYYIKKRIVLTNIPTTQASLFGSKTPTLPPLKLEYQVIDKSQELKDNLELESIYLGCFVSGHPIDQWKTQLQSFALPSIRDTKLSKRITGITVAGFIRSCKEIITKKGSKMAFCELIDQYDTIEVIVFPSVYQTFSSILLPDTCIIIKGKLDKSNTETKLLAQDIRSIYDENVLLWINQKPTKTIRRPSVDDIGNTSDESDTSQDQIQYNAEGEAIVGINIPIPKGTQKATLEEVKTILKQTPRGTCAVFLLLDPNTYKTKCIPTSFKVHYSEHLIKSLQDAINPYITS